MHNTTKSRWAINRILGSLFVFTLEVIVNFALRIYELTNNIDIINTDMIITSLSIGEHILLEGLAANTVLFEEYFICIATFTSIYVWFIPFKKRSDWLECKHSPRLDRCHY
mgnify:CR=1 FL=1